SGILGTIAQPSPVLIVVGLALVGLVAWLLVARWRHASTTVALNAWAQATCPACLILGSVAPLETEPGVRWSGVVSAHGRRGHARLDRASRQRPRSRPRALRRLAERPRG